MYILGKERVAGRVGSGQTFCRQLRVRSGQRLAGSGRVQEKWPVDNSAAAWFDVDKPGVSFEYRIVWLGIWVEAGVG